MVNDKYWLWLTLKKSMNPAKITVLLDRFENDIEKIYDADVYDEINEINIREKRELLNKSTDEAEKVIEKTEYFVYCGFFITHLWIERFAQRSKG